MVEIPVECIDRLANSLNVQGPCCLSWICHLPVYTYIFPPFLSFDSCSQSPWKVIANFSAVTIRSIKKPKKTHLVVWCPWASPKYLGCVFSTPPKTNMEAENNDFEVFMFNYTAGALGDPVDFEMYHQNHPLVKIYLRNRLKLNCWKSTIQNKGIPPAFHQPTCMVGLFLSGLPAPQTLSPMCSTSNPLRGPCTSIFSGS